MSRIFGRISGFLDFSDLSPDMGLSIRGFIQNTHVMFSNARVRVLEPTHGPISRHLWSAWCPDFWSDLRIFDFTQCESRFRPADQRNHWQHPGDAAARLSASRVAHPWPDSLIFLVHMVVGFLDGFRISDFRMAISTGLRAETMVDGLPRAFR